MQQDSLLERMLTKVGTYQVTAQEMRLTPFALTRRQFAIFGAIYPPVGILSTVSGIVLFLLSPFSGSKYTTVPLPPQWVMNSAGAVFLFIAVVSFIGLALAYYPLVARNIRKLVQEKYQIDITPQQARVLAIGKGDLDTFEGTGRIDTAFFGEPVTVRLHKTAGQEAILVRITENDTPDYVAVYGEHEQPLS